MLIRMHVRVCLFMYVRMYVRVYMCVCMYICVYIRVCVLCMYIYMYVCLYRVSQEECARLRESVPYVKLYRYNPKHLCPKLNGYGDNGQRKEWASLVSTY